MSQSLFNRPERIVLLDRSGHTEPFPVLLPFAVEELLCRKVAGGFPPVVHLWRHPRALVMGLRDSRLPKAAEAQKWLEAQGYQAAVRNSGGAAVPLDLGVVNVSLILPKIQGDVAHRKDFERMYGLVRDALQLSGIVVDKGEIQGSYCPGDFDLSVQGRKFCGIAQRRHLNGLIVQAFVVVEGIGADKAELARQFYAIASGGAGAADYPLVTPYSMASLSELAGTFSSEQFTEAVLQVLGRISTIEPWALTDLLAQAEINQMIDTLHSRYGIST